MRLTLREADGSQAKARRSSAHVLPEAPHLVARAVAQILASSPTYAVYCNGVLLAVFGPQPHLYGVMSRGQAERERVALHAHRDYPPEEVLRGALAIHQAGDGDELQDPDYAGLDMTIWNGLTIKAVIKREGSGSPSDLPRVITFDEFVGAEWVLDT
jgi:hypothetical protein